ncbi:FKBP-type peptidyl-prolyl cis-trans isomerase [Pedobacter sp. NJ-S-72]
MIKEGVGHKVETNSKVKVNYTGMLVNGKIFESTNEKGRPADISVGNTIKGWKEALPLMREGSKWDIIYSF